MWGIAPKYEVSLGGDARAVQADSVYRKFRGTKNNRFLGERYYVTFALWHEPSVCRLSSVVCRLSSSVHVAPDTQSFELFDNIFCTK